MKKEVLSRKLFVQNAVLEYAQSEIFRQFPWREKERSPYEVLIAEILLKRTTATAAAKLYTDLLRILPSIRHVYTTSQNKLEEFIRPLGLYKQRASSLKKMADYIVEEEGGEIPDSFDRLLKIPGVGHYNSRAVLSFAFNIPYGVVDSNVERILGRFFIRLRPLNHRLFQDITDELLPHDSHRLYNLAMLDIGSIVCRPSNPRCEDCFLERKCDYRLGEGRSISETNYSSEIRTLRLQIGMSQQGLAELSGVSKNTIVNLEVGRTTRPKEETLKKIKKALNLPKPS